MMQQIYVIKQIIIEELNNDRRGLSI